MLAIRNLICSRIPALTLVAVALLLTGVVAPAQDLTEPALKAIFLYNFAKFTQWPVGVMADASPLVMCVLGDKAVVDELERAVKGRAIAGHGIAVSTVVPAGLHACQVLYVSGMTAPQAAPLVATLRDQPVLTLSDVKGFIDLGGIGQFRFEQGQLRFSVRLESVRRARLEISSRLLALARIE